MADNSDIISSLSNNDLSVILSLLPFKEAARTSILSNRWRHVWRSTKNIEFLESFFVKLDDSEENKALHRRVFVDFIRQWMKAYNGPVIKAFSLLFSLPQNFPEDVGNCITFAVARNVKELSLDFHDPMWGETELENHEAVFDLPVHVYGHRGLESLKLFSCTLMVSEFNNFSALKQLSLGWIELSVNSMKALLVHCPLLESFSLKKCFNIDHLEVSVPNLRLQTLVLDRCDFVQSIFQIEAPKLRVFKYRGRAGHFYFESQQSMVEAELDFTLEFEFDEIGDLLQSLLEQLFSVRILTVCSYLLQVAPSGMEPLGLSTRLIVEHLILKTTLHVNEFCGIKFMLKSCPVLEILTINIGPARIFHDYIPPYQFNPQEFWIKHLVVYHCLTRTLRVVEVKGFTGKMNELLLLQYLVRFGNVMQELNIYLPKEVDADGDNNREEYLQRAQLVQQFSKASDSLQISIH